MCLTTRQLCPIKAKKPITVYKVVKEKLVEDMHGNKKYAYYSAFKNMRIDLNSQVVAEGPIMPQEFYLMKAGKYESDYYYRLSKHIGKGFIHCFTNIFCAKNMHASLSLYRKRFGKQFCIIECIIEPGTLYYKSSLGFNSEICARSLTTKGVIY